MLMNRRARRTRWITVSDYSRSRLATELEVSKGRVSQLINSQEEPSAHLIAKLLTLTHLPFDRLFEVIRTDGTSAKTSPRSRGNGRGVLVPSSE